MRIVLCFFIESKIKLLGENTCLKMALMRFKLIVMMNL